MYYFYQANTYTVVYNGNGATSGSTASSTHTYDVSKALTTNAFYRTGYTFQGWSTSATGSVVYKNGCSVLNLSATNGGTVNLYAVWSSNSYNVIYNGNGNTGGSTATSTHTYDVAKALTTNGFTRTGYNFKGWAINTSLANSHLSTPAYTDGQSVININDGSYGTPLMSDPTFTTSLPSAYSCGGTNAFSRIADASAPNDSGMIMRITNTGKTEATRIGGFCQSVYISPNETYYQVIVAKIPTGWYLSPASNSLGNGGSETFVTSNQGTGSWFTYVIKRTTGTTGNFDSTGDVSLCGAAGTAASPVVWDVAFAQMYRSTPVYGTEKFSDVRFISGLNGMGVYNNSGNGTVTVTRTAKGDVTLPFGLSSWMGTGPTSSQWNYYANITTTGTASPGLGGFVTSL